MRRLEGCGGWEGLGGGGGLGLFANALVRCVFTACGVYGVLEVAQGGAEGGSEGDEEEEEEEGDDEGGTCDDEHSAGHRL